MADPTPTSTPEPRPDVTDAQQSRNVFGTLTTPPSTKFTGAPLEQQTILNVLRAQCPSIIKLILQLEYHKKGDNDGNIHYHFLVCTGSPMRQTKLRKLRDVLTTFHTGRHDVQFAKAVSQVEKYLFKDYRAHDPFTQGYTGEEVDALKLAADQKKPEQVKTTNANKFEAEILERIREFMLTHHYSVNFYTRAVHRRDGLDRIPIDLRCFFEQLHNETTIPKDYGQRGIKLISEYIKDVNMYELPYFTPNRDYISFNNAVYGFTAGKGYLPTDPVVINITPIRHFDVDFPPPIPTAYFFLIHNHKWDLAVFVAQYGSMFKAKNRRDPCMYLWGAPLTGKSMLHIPLIEVFGDLVGNFTKDGNFSLACIVDKVLAILDEVDIWSQKDLPLQVVKKLLEGTDFTVARKNKEPAVVTPIHVLMTNNTKPREPVDQDGNRDYHIEAVLSRIHPYETRDLPHHDSGVINSIAIDHAPGWAVYCTQTEPYIKVPPKYLPSQ
jgi:Papillomavirus helicase